MVKSVLSDQKIPEPLQQDTDGAVHLVVKDDQVGLATETTLSSLDSTDFATEATLSSLNNTDFATETTLSSLLNTDFATEASLTSEQNRAISSPTDTNGYVQVAVESGSLSSDPTASQTYQTGADITAQGGIATLDTQGRDQVSVGIDADSAADFRIDASTDGSNWMTGWVTYEQTTSVRDTLNLGVSHIRVYVATTASSGTADVMLGSS